MVITDLGVFKREGTERRFRLKELAPDVTIDEIKAKTEADIVFE